MMLDQFVAAIRDAHDSHTPLRVRGAGSKDFYGGMLAGDVLDVSGYRGIVAYEPTELFITAKCGTPLADIEAALAAKGQMLACEPPNLSGATVGGCVAAGLSGPRRQQAGAVRDFVLGVKLVDGSGQVLDFGERRAASGGDVKLGRFVGDDTLVTRNVEHFPGQHAAVEILAAGAANAQRRTFVVRDTEGGNDVVERTRRRHQKRSSSGNFTSP